MSNAFKTGEKVIIQIDYELNSDVEDANVGFGIVRVDGLDVYASNTRIDRVDKYSLSKKGTINIVINQFMVLSGHYHLDVAIEDENDEVIDFWREAVEFDVFSTISDVGIMRIEHNWEINNE